MDWIAAAAYPWRSTVLWVRRFVGLLLWGAGAPRHVAFIMDGNRRYAKRAHQDNLQGHTSGYYKMVDVIKWCLEAGVECISVYAFSIENFKRSPDEVGKLMHLAETKFKELIEEEGLAETEGVEVRVIGDLALPPPSVQAAAARIMTTTAALKRKRAVLNICFSYTSTEELHQSVHSVRSAVQSGRLSPPDVGWPLLRHCLHTQDCPDVDLLIRTSGETRLSDFLLWQTRFALLTFVPCLWPDLSFLDFARSVLSWQRRRGVLCGLRHSAHQRVVECGGLLGTSTSPDEFRQREAGWDVEALEASVNMTVTTVGQQEKGSGTKKKGSGTKKKGSEQSKKGSEQIMVSVPVSVLEGLKASGPKQQAQVPSGKSATIGATNDRVSSAVHEPEGNLHNAALSKASRRVPVGNLRPRIGKGHKSRQGVLQRGEQLHADKGDSSWEGVEFGEEKRVYDAMGSVQQLLCSCLNFVLAVISRIFLQLAAGYSRVLRLLLHRVHRGTRQRVISGPHLAQEPLVPTEGGATHSSGAKRGYADALHLTTTLHAPAQQPKGLPAIPVLLKRRNGVCTWGMKLGWGGNMKDSRVIEALGGSWEQVDAGADQAWRGGEERVSAFLAERHARRVEWMQAAVAH